MKKQAYNPFLPNFEYIPDGEPYVFNGRLYVYGSHDRFNGELFCENDYVCWSAPVNKLYDWHFEGVIYRKTQDPLNVDGDRCMYAPDIQVGLDGRYYLYYTLDVLGIMSVAISNTPVGPFEYYGVVRTPDGRPVGESAGDIFQFDPGVFIDDDGRVYLYTGFAPRDSKMSESRFKGRLCEGAYCIELDQDMLTVKSTPVIIAPKVGQSQGTGFEGHEFFEASSMRKIDGMYYFIYSSINAHELCYATSDQPTSGFLFGGTIISNGDVFLHGRQTSDCLNYMGNNHGSLVEINRQWYVFYHRQTNKHGFSRQACAEPITIESDGSIRQVEMTSCGLNGGALSGKGRYETYIACNLMSKEGACFYVGTPDLTNHPYFTQAGTDREESGDQYIANMQNGAVAVFKYFDLSETTKVTISVRGNAQGEMLVLTGIDGDVLTQIPVSAEMEYKNFTCSLEKLSDVSALAFKYNGTGYLDFKSFLLE